MKNKKSRRRLIVILSLSSIIISVTCFLLGPVFGRPWLRETFAPSRPLRQPIMAQVTPRGVNEASPMESESECDGLLAVQNAFVVPASTHLEGGSFPLFATIPTNLPCWVDFYVTAEESGDFVVFNVTVKPPDPSLAVGVYRAHFVTPAASPSPTSTPTPTPIVTPTPSPSPVPTATPTPSPIPCSRLRNGKCQLKKGCVCV